jgi:acyl carrier protein
MNNMHITQQEIAAVFPEVAKIVADARGCDVEQVTLQASLINDLGAESIDFVDIVFRLQRTFKIKIPRGKILEDARGPLSPEEFEQKGVVSAAGVARLKAFLNEVPADRFPTPLLVTDIPRLFTTETFCKVVVRQQQAAASAPGPSA